MSQITQNAAVSRSRIYSSADDESEPLIKDSMEVRGRGGRCRAGNTHTHTQSSSNMTGSHPDHVSVDLMGADQCLCE